MHVGGFESGVGPSGYRGLRPNWNVCVGGVTGEGAERVGVVLGLLRSCGAVLDIVDVGGGEGNMLLRLALGLGLGWSAWVEGGGGMGHSY